MKIMEDHKWHDVDIKCVCNVSGTDLIEIDLKDGCAVLLSQKDVIRMANWFKLDVYSPLSRL